MKSGATERYFERIPAEPATVRRSLPKRASPRSRRRKAVLAGDETDRRKVVRFPNASKGSGSRMELPTTDPAPPIPVRRWSLKSVAGETLVVLILLLVLAAAMMGWFCLEPLRRAKFDLPISPGNRRVEVASYRGQLWVVAVDDKHRRPVPVQRQLYPTPRPVKFFQLSINNQPQLHGLGVTHLEIALLLVLPAAAWAIVQPGRAWRGAADRVSRPPERAERRQPVRYDPHHPQLQRPPKSPFPAGR